jgi:hypothetical protein
MRDSECGWTSWRLLADKRFWYEDCFDWDGPACYELGTGGPRGGRIQPHYVGETGNERRRIKAYASHGSHLADIIDDHLRRGWRLYYRAISCVSKPRAKELQDNLLARFEYDWNIILNQRGYSERAF